jgi:hypothetical protein
VRSKFLAMHIHYVFIREPKTVSSKFYDLDRAFTNFLELFLKHSPVYYGVDLVQELALSSSSGNIHTYKTAWNLFFDHGLGEGNVLIASNLSALKAFHIYNTPCKGLMVYKSQHALCPIGKDMAINNP